MSSNDEPKTTRRDFLGVAVGGSAVAFTVAAGCPLASYVEPPTQRTIGATVVGKVDEFPVGVARTVLVDERPVIVLRAADGQFRAFSAICSHLQCVVAYVPERNRIECPCHGGVYSVEGQNIAGPPPRPLDELAVTINDRSVIVSAIG